MHGFLCQLAIDGFPFLVGQSSPEFKRFWLVHDKLGCYCLFPKRSLVVCEVRRIRNSFDTGVEDARC